MIWITQWLCPSRHASIALVWDDSETTAQEIEERGEDLYCRGVINRWCGICRGELHVEHGRTGFKTMEEALPRVKAIEQANTVTRALIGGKF